MANLINLCLVCERQLNEPAGQFGGPWKFSCPACGNFLATYECCDDYAAYPKLRLPRSQAIIGHWLQRASVDGKLPLLTIQKAQDLVEQDWVPSHTDQANNLIRFIGDQTDIGVGADIHRDELQFIIGAVSEAAVPFLADHLLVRGLARRIRDRIALLPDGWTAYDALKRGQSTGHKAFMAMPFGKQDLDTTIVPVARDAATACGFHLERIDDQPRPGLIDIQMRVAIQEARFAIVDLTYENSGAYWEAGYAEGMGKPVIYMVRADHDASVHFDTAHLSRVIWEPDKLDHAERQIKAMIRNELPDAVHED